MSDTPHRPVARGRCLVASLLGAPLLVAAGCAVYQPFDSEAFVRDQVTAQAGAPAGVELTVPFVLSPGNRERVANELKAVGDARRRAAAVVSYIFDRLELRYRQFPTRTADEALAAREGNCLSFVNLFVAIARQQRLAPFFVEVTDYQRWDSTQGFVVSRGHIVAGLNFDRRLETFDFLPYRPKSYRSFRPIDDLTSVAHYYNNRAGEALLAGDLEGAEELLQEVAAFAPGFLPALNNLGVVLARRGDLVASGEVYRRGLEADPGNQVLLTNLASLHQRRGEPQLADQILARLDDGRQKNPFFFVYLSEVALAAGHHSEALRRLQRALSLDRDVPEVHFALARTYLALGELDKSRRALARGRELDPDHPELGPLEALLGPLGSEDARSGDSFRQNRGHGF